MEGNPPIKMHPVYPLRRPHPPRPGTSHDMTRNKFNNIML